MTTDRWHDDKLGRKTFANALTAILSKRHELISDSNRPNTLTLNIRADWGYGKTFFLKRWSEDLRDEGFPVVYFDAWSNDHSNDPLIGFIAEMNNSLTEHFRAMPPVSKHLDDAVAHLSKLIKPLGGLIASAITQKILGTGLEQIKEYFENEKQDGEVSVLGNERSSLAKDLAALADLAIKEHLSRQAVIKAFKNKMQKLIAALKDKSGVEADTHKKINLPVFIFVDELDRCRPTYAIELLEQIKHLFGIDDIYFILSTNMEQLGHSIKVVYGESFDSDRYLRRFFDQEYLLPEPNRKQFVKFIFEEYGLHSLAKNHYSVIENHLYTDELPLEVTFRLFGEACSLSLRDQKQVALSLQSVLLSWPIDERVHFAYMLFLVIAKQASPEIFKRLVADNYEAESDFSNGLQSLINRDVKFRTSGTAANGANNGVDEKTIFELVKKYWTFSRKTINEYAKTEANYINFPNKILDAIWEDSRKQRFAVNLETKWPCVKFYASRVSNVEKLQLIQPT